MWITRLTDLKHDISNELSNVTFLKRFDKGTNNLDITQYVVVYSN